MSNGISDAGWITVPVEAVAKSGSLELLERIATAVEKVGEKSEKTAEKTASLTSAWDAIGRGANAFNEITDAVGTVVGSVEAAAQHFATLADEQARLTRLSARLGLDFNAAADSAGRFADETESMGAAASFAQRDIRLTQAELNALTRVAGSASEVLGISTAAATEKLTAALQNGAEEGLAPFGAELLATAGHSHTVGERLAVLVRHAEDVEPASDSAGDAIARFRDQLEDSERTFATAFVDGLRELTKVQDAFGQTGDSAEEWTRDITAAGQTAAEVFLRVANGLGVVFGTIATGVAGILSGLHAVTAGVGALATGGDFTAALNAARNNSPVTDFLADFTANRLQSLERLDALGDQRTSAAAGFTPDMSFAPGDTAGQPDMVIGIDEARSDIARRRRGGGGRRGGARRAGSSGPPQLPHERHGDAAGLALLFSQATRIREGQDAMFAATEDKRMSSAEAANDNSDDYDQYASDRNADTIEARERRTYEQRYEALRGFSDLWEQEHSRQLTAVQGLVQGADAAFGSFGQAYTKHLGLLVSGQESAGQALQGFLADTLEGVSARTGARAGEEFAEGLASLASPITAPFAPAHFAAAAAFTGVSVATGVAGAAMRPSTPAAGAGGAARGAGDLPPGVGTGRAPERREGTSITINLGGGVVLGSPRELAEQLGRVLNDPSADFLLNPDRVRTAA